MSPGIFQHVMNDIIKGLTGVVVYQDDVIIHAVDKNSHNACILALFRRFQTNVCLLLDSLIVLVILLILA